MNWLLTAALCVALVEIATRLPLGRTAAELTRSSRKAARVVAAGGVSDHWKEKAMRAYAATTFRATLRLALLLAVLFGGAALLALIFAQLSAGFYGFLLGWRGILFTLVFASLYYAARKAVLRG